MNIFLMRGFSDWRYASLTSTTHIRKPLIFAITRVMRTDTHWMVRAPWNRQSFMISKCPTGMCLSLYCSSLSSSDFMARTYLAVIRFAPSGRSVLSTARKVPLLTRSRILAYLASIILDKFALGSFGLIISVNQYCSGLTS